MTVTSSSSSSVAAAAPPRPSTSRQPQAGSVEICYESDKKEIEIIELSSGGLDDTYEDMESTPELDVVLSEAKSETERENCLNFYKGQARRPNMQQKDNNTKTF